MSVHRVSAVVIVGLEDPWDVALQCLNIELNLADEPLEMIENT